MSESVEQTAQVAAHNAKAMWCDVSEHLLAAKHELALAQGVLDDLDVPHISENLVPHVEAIERFRALAEDKATA